MSVGGSSGPLLAANNLGDVGDRNSARANLGALVAPAGTPTAANQSPVSAGSGSSSTTWVNTLTLGTALGGTAGYSISTGTPTLLTWTAPNDGNVHRVSLIAQLHVTATQTGGAVQFSFTAPDGDTPSNTSVFAGGASASFTEFSADRIIGPDTTFSLLQTSTMSGGTAVLWAQMWVS